MEVRFSKFSFLLESGEQDSFTNNQVLPLEPKDYPIGGSLGNMLKYESNAISPMVREDIELQGLDEDALIGAIGHIPTFPNSDPSHPFWSELLHVIQAQEYRVLEMTEMLPTLPDLWEGVSMAQYAEYVHDEYPGYWQAQLLMSFFPTMTIDYGVLPERSKYDFVGGPIRFAALNTWATDRVSAINFRAKWKYGRPRPEEVAYLVFTGDIPKSSVPPDLYVKIMEFVKGIPADEVAATDFTAYAEGSPRHPSWPAMHSAASSSSFWMSVVLDLTDEQYCQALLTDYAVSYARTVAGVHYPSDNIDGLNLGQEILAEYLKDHLVERYGANEVNTQAKIDANRFDWNDFDPDDCETFVSIMRRRS